MFRLVSVTRLSAAAVALVGILPATLLPAWAALLLLALILAALNLLELIRNDRTGWRTVFSDKTGAASAEPVSWTGNADGNGSVVAVDDYHDADH